MMMKMLKGLMFIIIITITVFFFIMIHQTSGFERSLPFWPRYYGVNREVLHNCTTRRTVQRDQKSSSVVAVNGSKTLLISAYLEHRTNQRNVRVIGVALRKEYVAYHCLICCLKDLHKLNGYQEIHADHFGFAYGTADIMCPVPPDCITPTFITVSAAAEKPPTSEGVCSGQPQPGFLEVKNQHKTSKAFRYNFTVCMSTMFDFTNVLQLVQSLEMLKLLGVNRVAIYKSSCNTETQRVLDYYTHTGLVEVIPWTLPRFINVSRSWLPSHGPGDLHYFGQLAALNDCLYRYMYQSRYLAMHDVDELILPQAVDSWEELLPSLEKKHGTDHCYKFECYVFPNVAVAPSPSSGTPAHLWSGVSGVNILDHLHHEPPNSETYSNFKIIFDPRAVFSVTVHGLLTPWDRCHWVDKSVARIYHTRSPKQIQLKADQLIYDARLLDYSDHLMPAVIDVLKRYNQINC